MGFWENQGETSSTTTCVGGRSNVPSCNGPGPTKSIVRACSDGYFKVTSAEMSWRRHRTYALVLDDEKGL